MQNSNIFYYDINTYHAISSFNFISNVICLSRVLLFIRRLLSIRPIETGFQFIAHFYNLYTFCDHLAYMLMPNMPFAIMCPHAVHVGFCIRLV